MLEFDKMNNQFLSHL